MSTCPTTEGVSDVLIPMSKVEFVARMLEDAERRRAEEAESKKRAAKDFADYTAMRKSQTARYMWRHRKR